MEFLTDACTRVYNTAHYIYHIPQNFNEKDAAWLIDSYPDYGAYATVIYLWVVFRLPKIMENRKPFSLRYVTFAWNLSLSIFSTLGTWALVPPTLSMLQTNGLRNTCCIFDGRYRGGVVFWIVVFAYSKTPELLDTLFLVLKKRPVSFLHWYHHLATALFCWHASYTVAPTVLLFAVMNYTVHSIMYFYYALVSLGYRRSIRPIAPLITTLQILQMFAGTYIISFAAYQTYVVGNCEYDHTSLRMGLMMYASYCVLFCVLFKELYLDRPIMADVKRSRE